MIHRLSRVLLASAIVTVTAACANPTAATGTTPIERPEVPWSLAVSAGGDANAQWVGVSSPFDWSAASSAITVCGNRVGTRCSHTKLCTAAAGTWTALSRRQVEGVYDYQLTCGARSSDEALSRVSCDDCEILWPPRVVRSYGQ